MARATARKGLDILGLVHRGDRPLPIGAVGLVVDVEGVVPAFMRVTMCTYMPGKSIVPPNEEGDLLSNVAA